MHSISFTLTLSLRAAIQSMYSVRKYKRGLNGGVSHLKAYKLSRSAVQKALVHYLCFLIHYSKLVSSVAWNEIVAQIVLLLSWGIIF